MTPYGLESRSMSLADDHPFLVWFLCVVVLSLLGGVGMFFWVLAGYALGIMR